MEIRTEINIPANLKDEPIICNLCKKFNIVVNIIEASFSTEVGWAILIFHGEDKEIERAFSFLKEMGVEIENTEITSH
jgi:ABC-type methionine transport system ATPase subunit